MIAIVNGKVLTITHGTLEKGVVLMDGGKIVDVGVDLEIPADARVVDAAGKYVLPGLIDAHCHAGLFGDGVGWEHADGNEMTDPVTPHLRALDAVHPEDLAFPDIIESGVTTILTGPGSANLIGGTWICIKTVPRSSIEQMTLKEPAGMKMALGENPRRVYGTQKRAPSTRMANAAELRMALVKAQNYMMKWEQYGKDKAEYEEKTAAGGKDLKVPTPPERDLKMEALVPVLRREMRVHIHAHRADDILTAVRIGEEFNLDFNIEHCTEGYKIADILAEKRKLTAPWDRSCSHVPRWNCAI